MAQVEEAHTALMQGIAPLLKAKGVEASSLAHPTQLVVGVWSRPGVVKHDTGYTGAHTRKTPLEPRGLYSDIHMALL